MVKVSVIIPCYNQGKYVTDAIDSVLDSNFNDLEIIVVNDGSTDEKTNTLLHTIQRPKTKVIETENQGASQARNTAILASQGEYILPLDADDIIYPTYIGKAVAELDNHQDLGIIYAKGEYFGLKHGIWELPEYSLKQIINNNCIPVCGMFRRQDYNKTSGYNANMIDGLEDWDFWLSLIENGVKVKILDEILFKYRQVNNSRTASLKGKKDITHYQIVNNHLSFYMDNIFLLNRYILSILLKKRNRRELKKMGNYNPLIVILAQLKYLPSDILQIFKMYLLFPIYVYRVYQQLKEKV